MTGVLEIVNKHALLLACLLIVLSIGQAVATIEQYPDLGNDEAYFGIPAYELATSGRLRNRVTCLAGAEEKDLYPFLVTVSLAPIFWLDRDAGPAVLRLVPIACSFIALTALLFLLRRRLDVSPSVTVLAVAAIAVDPLFFISQRMVRPEAWLILCTVTAVIGVLDEERPLRGAGLTGAAVGIAAMTHILAVPLYVATVVCWWCLRGLKWRELVVLHTAALICVLPYVLYVVSTPDWLAQLNAQAAWRYERAGVTGSSWLVRKLTGVWQHWSALTKPPYRLHYVALPFVTGMLIWRGAPRARALALMAVTFYFFAVLITSSKFSFRYFAPIVPLVFVAVAFSLREWQGGWRRAAATGLVLATFWGGVLDAGVLWKHREQAVSHEVAKLAETPRGDGRILGEQRFWFAFRDEDYVSWDAATEVVMASRPSLVWLGAAPPGQFATGGMWRRDLLSTPRRDAKRSAVTSWLSTVCGIPGRDPEREVVVSGHPYVGFGCP